jgi:TP901 family phage tail tape measure protein
MAFGADRSVKVNLTANVTDFIGKLTAAQKKTLDLSKDISRMSKQQRDSFDKIGRAATIGGVAIVGALGAAAKAYMDFEAAMSGVAAVAGANARELEALSEAAVQAGQDTVFSASEAAKAEAELAKAGVAVKDILGGGLTGALDLAAAGQIDLANAATISAQAMNIFNLEGRDVGHIADVLTAGANKSAAGVADLGQALSQGGLLAKQTGLSLEDTVGALSVFADNALIGSDAGTSLKTMLQRLIPSTEGAATAMDEIGLDAFDAQGNFVGLTTVAGQLRDGLSKLTQERRNEALMTIFGQDAIRGANILYEEGAEGLQTYIDAVNDVGAAQRMAARQTDNLKGDLEQLKGALESAFINAGSGGNEALRNLAQSLTDLVNKFNELPESTQANIVKFAAFAAGTLLLTGGVIKATTSLLAMRESLKSAGVPLDSLTGKMGKVAAVGARVALSLAAVANADKLFGNSKAEISIRRLADELAEADGSLKAVNARFAEAADFSMRADSGIKDLGDALDAAFEPTKIQRADDAVGRLFSTFGGTNYSDIATASQRFDQLDQSLARMVSSGNVEAAKQGFFEVSQEAIQQGRSLKEINELFPSYLESLDALNSAPVARQKELSENLQLVKDNAEDAETAVRDYLQSLQDAGLVVLNSNAAERDFQASLANVKETLDENREAVIKDRIEKDKSKRTDEQKRAAAEAYADANKKLWREINTTTEAGRANGKALDDAARSALDRAQAKFDETGQEKDYRDSLINSKAELIKVATQFGLNATEAKAYADEVLKIPPKVTTTASFQVVGLTGLKAAGEYLKGLKDRNVTLTVGTIRTNDGSVVNAGQFADGGPVYGPGTSRSDSIPAYLSNGEYVMKAAAVAKYGTTFFDQVNAMRFADGGLVAPRQVTSSSHVETNNAPVYIERVEGPSLAHIEAEAERRRRTKQLGAF